MNTLHFYAYYNLPSFLERGLIEDAPFYASNTGHTPLSIALDLKYVGCVRAVVKGLRTRMKEHPLNLYFFENSLTSLNNLGYGGLHRIYELLFAKSFNRALPKFSVSKIDDIYREHDSLLIDSTNFMSADSFGSDGTSIRFRQSFCKIPLTSGSISSLEFIDSICECKNTKIFETDIIRIILTEK